MQETIIAFIMGSMLLLGSVYAHTCGVVPGDQQAYRVGQE